MSRPLKWRKIAHMPSVMHFYPQVANPETAGENILKIEELEALRLKDLEGLEQKECAAKMEISRPTFQRILISAREKVADSLVHGKAIRIEGGKYTRGINPMRCLDCGRSWEESEENTAQFTDEDHICSQCSSDRLQYGTAKANGHGMNWQDWRTMPGRGMGRGGGRGMRAGAGGAGAGGGRGRGRGLLDDNSDCGVGPGKGARPGSVCARGGVPRRSVGSGQKRSMQKDIQNGPKE